MYKIKKSNLTPLFRAIAENRELYVPVSISGQVNFAAWDEEAEVSLDTLKTVKSPKDAFFPQFETLYTCRKEGKRISIQPEALREKDFVVFGMKACDVKGLEVLDRVFLAEPADTYYAARRAHGTIVALACHEPEESCFCKVFGVDAAGPAVEKAQGDAVRTSGASADTAQTSGESADTAQASGVSADTVQASRASEDTAQVSRVSADVASWLIEDELFWKPLTDKGEALTEAVKAFLENADQETERVAAEQEYIRGIVEKLPYSGLSLEGWNGGATKEKFDSAVWETLYKPCLACGTCTFVCPTCQCYDIKDYQTKDGVQRYRCWDSCMYSDFTLMAGGNNRTTQLQRFRQRFMHKLVYFPANNDGMYSCVGCGRCVEKCPSALNIVKVVKAFEKRGGDRA